VLSALEGKYALHYRFLHGFINEFLTSSDGPETGSIFAFWIPVGDESTQSVLHTIGEAEFTSSPTLISEGARGILLVEDNPINQVVIKYANLNLTSVD
jgi:arabinogalactan endo-1,4-beta-galactosidase